MSCGACTWATLAHPHIIAGPDLCGTPLCVGTIQVILSFQNEDGGWATYENTRAGAWYEILNPSEVCGVPCALQ